MVRRLRLHHRLLLPLALTALATSALIAYVTLAVAGRALRSRAEAQVVGAADVLAQADFALNVAILRSARALAGIDVVSYATDGTLLASTLPPDDARQLLAALAAAEDGAPAGPVYWDLCAAPCAVAVRPLRTPPRARLAVVAATADVDAVTRNVAQTIAGVALLSLVVLLLVSQASARGLTRPLERLVAFTREATPGTPARAPDGDDEVGTLGRAFNDMLDRLRDSQDALVRSEKLALTGMLAARVAHDVRNPLSSIKMQTQLLRDRLRGTADAATAASLAAVQRDILQVESVVQNLLDLARPGELRRSDVQVPALIDEALQHVRPHLAYRRIELHTALDPATPPLTLDRERVKQALLNVIHNAVDAMPGGGTLTVRCAAAGEAVTIAIEDDGAGIDPAVLPRAFEPFVSTKPHGIGLGLVNARAVVDNHGGTIRLEPRSHGGTRVTIQLPLTARHG